MSLTLILVVTALLLVTAACAVGLRRDATRLVYGASFALAAFALIVALADLASADGAATRVLPLGLPWIGAHFRLDALAAFFLVVVNLGAAAASVYGARLRPARARARARAAVLPGVSRRHEPRRAGRRCVHVPARLGVHVARLVGAGDGAPSRARQRAGRLRLPGDGELRHAVRCCWPSACSPGRTGGYAFEAIRSAEPAPAGRAWSWRSR